MVIAMSVKLKKLALTLATVAIFLSLPFANIMIAVSTGGHGEIDLYTQKEPYSGKGLNKRSDAFGPEEPAVLYTLVTFNDLPLQNLLVAFCVHTPTNASFSLSARTNASGIAAVNFTIPRPSENVSESEVFGEWHVLANVLIDNQYFQDSLTFKVNWIVKLISARAIDQNLIHPIEFGLEGDVGIEITLRSIAMITKSATIAVVLQDELGVPVSYSEMDDFMVQPNEKLAYLYCKLFIPKWAHSGNATIFVSALTTAVNASGVPYCPAISAGLYISETNPLTVTFHDVAVVGVMVSPESVEAGQVVNITAVAQNEGTESESFNVQAYYGTAFIESLPISLSSHSHAVLNFDFNTTAIASGNYTITVSTPYLLNEVDLTDNVFVDGVVEIRPKLPPIVHDIAIVDVKVSNNSLYIGDLLIINVSIVNKGTVAETFAVEAHYDSSLIQTLQVTALSPGAQVRLILMWDTSSANEGSYQISAYAPLLNDVSVSDNTFIDGVVELKPAKLYYLTVKTDPLGIVDISGGGWYREGTSVNLAAPEYVQVSIGARYRFSFWDVNASAKSGNPIIVIMDANHTATAHYALQYYLDVTTDPSGVAAVLGGGWYDEFSNVTLDAPVVSDYDFGYWDVNGVSMTGGVNPITIFMNEPKNATAHYTPKPRYTLTITTTAGGTTDPEPGTYTYVAGSTVQVTAIPNTYYVFDHWELDGGNVGSTSPYTVMMNGNHTLRAVFSFAPFSWFVSEWAYWLLLALLILVIFLIALFYRRRRQKQSGEAFFTGWAAWYYRFDLRGKTFRKV
jgi:hypothetical protein